MTPKMQDVLAPVALVSALLGTLLATFSLGSPDPEALAWFLIGLVMVLAGGYLFGISWRPLRGLSRRTVLISGVVVVVILTLAVLRETGLVPALPLLSSPWVVGLSLMFGTALLVSPWTRRGPPGEKAALRQTGPREPPHG